MPGGDGAVAVVVAGRCSRLAALAAAHGREAWGRLEAGIGGEAWPVGDRRLDGLLLRLGELMGSAGPDAGGRPGLVDPALVADAVDVLVAGRMVLADRAGFVAGDRGRAGRDVAEVVGWLRRRLSGLAGSAVGHVETGGWTLERRRLVVALGAWGRLSGADDPDGLAAGALVPGLLDGLLVEAVCGEYAVAVGRVGELGPPPARTGPAGVVWMPAAGQPTAARGRGVAAG